MKLINVYIEHLTLQLNQLFTYACDEPVQKGCRVKVDFAHRKCIGFVQETDVKSDLKNMFEVAPSLEWETNVVKAPPGITPANTSPAEIAFSIVADIQLKLGKKTRG